MKISEFFNNDYVDQASYDNLRKIASLVDGQKNASRKILYTVLEKNIKEKVKVSQLGSKVAEYAEYLHGSLDGVVVNLAQDFTGTNNIPLLQKKGNFGTRFAQEASAARYIYSYGSNAFFDLFKKQDSKILKQQYFEGQAIEPMFYTPTLPLLLINGSEGVSSGFAQKILPRNPELIKKYMIQRLEGGKATAASLKKIFTPYYNGFNGTIEQGETSSQWVISGLVERKSSTKVLITEVPVGYDLKGYLKVLDDLEDKKVITSYRDLSEDDQFKFEVSLPSKLLKSLDNDGLLSTLKLQKRITENYTVIDDNNKIRVFDSAKEIFDAYLEVKLRYMGTRKAHLIEMLQSDITLDMSRYTFVKAIVTDELVVNKRKRTDIEANLDKLDGVVKKDDSYDYLLNMGIMSLTLERLIKLEKAIKESKAELKALSKKSIEELLIEDLN